MVPYLLAEVFASNIGGTATLVGDPPNIIIASRGGLSFNDFLVHLAPVVVVLVAVLIGLCRWLFADAFHTDEKRVAEILALNEREAIKDHRLLVQSLVVLGLVLAAFVLSPVLGYAALGRRVARRRTADRRHPGHHRDRAAGRRMGNPRLLHGPVHHGRRPGRGGRAGGARQQHRRLRRRATCSRSPASCCGAPGLLSGIVDNIPYVASMSPVVADIIGPDGEPQVLWWALALGADLGGNATLVGASANVVVAGIAARNGTPIGFWQFTRHGLVIAGATLAVSTLYVWLRYFLLAG